MFGVRFRPRRRSHPVSDESSVLSLRGPMVRTSSRRRGNFPFAQAKTRSRTERGYGPGRTIPGDNPDRKEVRGGVGNGFQRSGNTGPHGPITHARVRRADISKRTHSTKQPMVRVNRLVGAVDAGRKPQPASLKTRGAACAIFREQCRPTSVGRSTFPGHQLILGKNSNHTGTDILPYPTVHP